MSDEGCKTENVCKTGKQAPADTEGRDESPAENNGGGGDSNETEEQEEEEEEIKFETVPFDPRFPNQNQTKHCYMSYVDYHRCVKLRGEDFPACEYYKRAYKSLCPNSWIEKWDAQQENGTFPGKI